MSKSRIVQVYDSNSVTYLIESLYDLLKNRDDEECWSTMKMMLMGVISKARKGIEVELENSLEEIVAFELIKEPTVPTSLLSQHEDHTADACIMCNSTLWDVCKVEGRIYLRCRACGLTKPVCGEQRNKAR